jgi:hypothetical protein
VQIARAIGAQFGPNTGPANADVLHHELPIPQPLQAHVALQQYFVDLQQGHRRLAASRIQNLQATHLDADAVQPPHRIDPDG